MTTVSLPLGKGHYVYRLIRDGKTVYVGETGNVIRRLAGHINMGRVFDDVQVTTCGSKPERRQLERELIALIQPVENIRGVHGRIPADPGWWAALNEATKHESGKVSV